MRTLTTGSWFERMYFVGLILVCFSMPFNVRFNSFSLIIAGVATIAWYIAEGRRSMVVNRRLLILPCYYLLCFVAFFTSDDTRSVLFDLEQKIPILALPLIFLAGPAIDEDDFWLIRSMFLAAVLFVCFRIILAGFDIGFRNDLLFENLPTIRRPYLGIYCVLASFLSVDGWLKSNIPWEKALYLLAASFFAILPALVLAKMAVITWVILVAVLAIWYLASKRKFKLIGALAAVVLALGFYFFFIHDKGRDIKDRILTMTEFDWNSYDAHLVNSVNLRFIKWNCSFEVLSVNSTWLAGAGTGESQKLLNECYLRSLGPDSFLAVDNYNSHNQFLTTWLNLGLIGFLFLIGHFVYALIVYRNSGQWLPFIFTTAIVLFCLTESVFEVQKGIVLYAFFQSLFFKISSNSRSKPQ